MSYAKSQRSGDQMFEAIIEVGLSFWLAFVAFTLYIVVDRIGDISDAFTRMEHHLRKLADK
jgi:hypothetical protein